MTEAKARGDQRPIGDAHRSLYAGLAIAVPITTAPRQGPDKPTPRGRGAHRTLTLTFTADSRVSLVFPARSVLPTTRHRMTARPP